jgi:pimeloyl-ACP methyl ester carboxylesterase
MWTVFAALVAFFAAVACSVAAEQPATKLTPVGMIPANTPANLHSPVRCPEGRCKNRFALVFVHGIFSSSETFGDWPENIKNTIKNVPIDVYRLEYKTALFTWVESNTAQIDDVVYDALEALKPLHQHQYDAIGFIGHSLGGNVIASYIHTIKAEYGHPERARIAFVITLATPYSGAQIANTGRILQRMMNASDPLLRSLEWDNPFLRMLKRWRISEGAKGERYGCRPLGLFAAYETKSMYNVVQVVPAESATEGLEPLFSAPPKPFALDHSQMSHDRLVVEWASPIIESEFIRAKEWSEPLCHQIIVTGPPLGIN